jgi:hypothetical protein
LNAYLNGTGILLNQGAINYSDAIIRGSEELPEYVEDLLRNSGKPVLEYQNEEDLLKAYMDFYHSLMEETVDS